MVWEGEDYEEKGNNNEDKIQGGKVPFSSYLFPAL